MLKRPTSSGTIPQSVPVFPFSGALLLPHTHRPLNIFEPRYLALVDHLLATNRLVGLVQPLDTSEESPQGDVPLQKIGCLGRLVQFEEIEEGRYIIVLEGISRFELGEELETDTPFRQFSIDPKMYETDFDPDFDAKAVNRSQFLTMMRDYAEFADLDINWEEIERTSTPDLINLACMLSPYGAAEMQVLLEAGTLAARAETLIAIAELEMARSQSGTALQ